MSDTSSTDQAQNHSDPTDRPPAEPNIAASTSLPELIIKAVILGVVLWIIQADENAYLDGLTSASPDAHRIERIGASDIPVDQRSSS